MGRRAKRKNESVTMSDGLVRFNSVSAPTNALFHVIFILLAILAVTPLLYVIAVSFSDGRAIQDNGYALIPAQFSLDGYAFLFRQKTMIFRSLGISLFVTVVGTGLGLILTTLMGYVISRREYKMRKFFNIMVFVPMIFNGGIVASYVINTQVMGLKNSVWALVLPLCVSSFNVIVAKTFFRMTVPDSLIESAKIDGASQWRIFFGLVLPISLPVVATISLFLCFAYWNDWFQSLLYISDSKLYSLQAMLNNIMSGMDALMRNAAQDPSLAPLVARLPKESARMAVVVVIVLPIACAYPFFQRYFISGLTVGAVKE